MTTELEWNNHPIFGIEEPSDPQRWLFHYTSLPNAAAIALTGELILSPLQDLNDPQEAIMHPIENWAFPPKTMELTEDLRSQIVRAVLTIREQIRLACFITDAPALDESLSRRLDARGHARSRSWAQYAENHSGACLIFDRTLLESAAASAFRATSPPWASPSLARGWKAQTVSYEPGVNSSIYSTQFYAFYAPDKPAAGIPELAVAIVESLFHKNTDWEAEREYRLVNWNCRAADCVLPVREALVAVAFGCLLKPRLLPIAAGIVKHLTLSRSAAVMYRQTGTLRPLPLVGPDGECHIWSDADLANRVMFERPTAPN
ncbi:MAG TPA: DUF2971 domain-containing protein [Actinomycetota bacterium]|nr:DUF2971 domain-containing protein [Actinomycetota bacterium]